MAILALNIVLFLLFGTAVIWHLVAPQDETPMTYVAVKAPAKPPEPPAHGGEAAKANLDPTVNVAPPSTSVASVVVTSNPMASFSMQSVDVPISNLVLPSFTQPAGSGLGQGSGGGGIAHSNPFGDAVQDGVPGLIGELYDLKQTPDGTPTAVSVKDPELPESFYDGWRSLPSTIAGLDVLRAYVKTWDQQILDKYYKSPVSLSATQLFIPERRSIEATKAFGVADKVIAKRWVIHYHGTIVPQKSGRFRFLGFGDDFLVVRLGSQNVLDGCWPGETLDPTANGKDERIPGPIVSYGGGFNLHCGKWIDLEQGAAQSMDILIGEGPGGNSSFFLLIEEEGDTSEKGDYSVFQIAPTAVPTNTGFSSVFTGKTMLFSAQ